jgi:two-component system chemotaxis response regulator CheY
MRVLIVDDSSFMREHLRRLLDGMGIASMQAVDGQAALEVLCSNGPFDLMLLDLNMPVMDGFACVKALRREGRYASMKIMVIALQDDYTIMDRAFAEGVDEFLMKPFTLRGLREKLLLLGFAETRSLAA